LTKGYWCDFEAIVEFSIIKVRIKKKELAFWGKKKESSPPYAIRLYVGAPKRPRMIN
jgi:hypothetical protein